MVLNFTTVFNNFYHVLIEHERIVFDLYFNMFYVVSFLFNVTLAILLLNLIAQQILVQKKM